MRLELARTFFLKGQDGLARRHFELVLAGGVPPVVAAHIRRFLHAMQTRKRFTGYFGAAVAPDSNLNAASESEIIYVDTVFGRLPFTRQGDFGARSGFGFFSVGRRRVPAPPEPTAAAAGGRRPGAAGIQRRRLRPALPGHACRPRWLASPITELSLLATAQRQWLGGDPYVDETGVRLELDRRLTPRLWARGTAAYRERDHRVRDDLDGPVIDFTATFAWTPAPVLRVHVTAGYERGHASSEHWRNLGRWVRVGTSLALPLGFTLGTSAQMRRTYYEGSGQVHHTLTAGSGWTAPAPSPSRCSTAPSPCSASAPSWRSSTKPASPTPRRRITTATAPSYASCGSSDTPPPRSVPPRAGVVGPVAKGRDDAW